MSAMIHVRFTVPALHGWPEAPEHRSYLRASHRHLFHVKVEVPVEHDDRAIEFHDLADFCRNAFCNMAPRPPSAAAAASHVVDLGRRSCEQMAAHVAGLVLDKWPVGWVTVVVEEDGEFGATVSASKVPPRG